MKFAKQIFLVCLVLSATISSAQVVVEGISTEPAAIAKPKRGLNVHIAYNYGVINNHYEIRGLYKSGIEGGLVYRFGQWFAIEGTFTRYQKHTSASLTDVQAWCADLNGNLSMRMGETDLYFRTIFGMGYVDWKGVYVGPNLNDNYHYYFGKLIKDQFWTFNLGCGFSHYFLKQRLEGFGDFRLRIAGDPKVLFAITDTHFAFGMRYCITDRSSKDKRNENGKDGKDGKGKRKTNSERNRKVYKWVKDRS